MKLVSLQMAVAQIKEACEAAKENRTTTSPFWFLVGAGVSYPSVPLASAIILDCKKHAEERGHSTEYPGEDPLGET